MIKQFVNSQACLECKGCCRFYDSKTVWTPHLLKSETEKIGEKINLRFAGQENIYYCSFFLSQENKCRLYPDHPLDCQLYPFVFNRKGGKVFLAVDPNCPQIKENLEKQALKEYAKELAEFFSAKNFQEMLKINPCLIQVYPGVVDLIEISVQ